MKRSIPAYLSRLVMTYVKKAAWGLPSWVIVLGVCLQASSPLHAQTYYGQILSPSAGQQVYYGDNYEINWTGIPSSYSQCDIYFSSDGGTTWSSNPLNSSPLSTASGTWVWQNLPFGYYPYCMLQVRAWEPLNPVQAKVTSGMFSIGPVIEFNVTSPKGGQTLVAGSPQNISWSYYGSGNQVDVEIFISINGGAFGQLGTTYPMTDNSLPWNTSAFSTSTNCQLRLKAIFSGIVVDSATSGTFTIVPPSVNGTVLDNNGTPIPNVVMQGLPGNPTTNSSGNYSVNVTYGQSYTFVPTYAAYIFNPSSQATPAVTSQLTYNFTGTMKTYAVQGQVLTSIGAQPMAGVTLNGLPGSPVTDANGDFAAIVPYGTNVTITPSMNGYTFSPSNDQLGIVTKSYLNQNFTVNTSFVSGVVQDNYGNRLSGVTMNGFPYLVRTSSNGQYNAWPPSGWSGTVTPSLNSYVFDPRSLSYYNLTGTTGAKPETGYLPPPVPTNPSPSDGASNVQTNTSLSWSGSPGSATTYQLQVSTDPQVQSNYIVNTTVSSPFYSALSLQNGTQYYWHVQTLNPASGTWSPIWKFETVGPTISVSQGSLSFGNVQVNTTSSPQSFTLSGSNLTANVTVTAPSGFMVSTSSGGPYQGSVPVTPSGGSINQTIYVVFTPTSATSYNESVQVSGGGAATQSVSVTGTGTTPPPVAKSISKTSGDNQSGLISSTLPQPLVVTVTDASGNPVSGITVAFAITSTPSGATGQGLSTPTATTGSNGQASATLTLGNVQGTYTVTATSAGLTGSPVTFNETATNPPPVAKSISKTSGDNQSGLISSTLPQPLVVTVTDASGNPVSGTTVTFAITSTPSGATGQTVSAPTATTGSNGQASTTLTLGNRTGTYIVTATSAGLIGSPLSFTDTASNSSSIEIQVTPGTLNFDSVEVDSTSLPQSFVLLVNNVKSSLTLTAPSGFEIWQPLLLSYGSSLTITPINGSISSTVRVVFDPVDTGQYSGNVSYSVGGVLAMVGPPFLTGKGMRSSSPTFLLGDVDGNGLVQAADASLILQYVVGLKTLTAAQLAAADVNGDGVVSAYDASWILHYVVYGTWPSSSRSMLGSNPAAKRQSTSK